MFIEEGTLQNKKVREIQQKTTYLQELKLHQFK